MSLGIAFKGPEGIVLAADSRVTLNNSVTQPNGHVLILPSTFDNATKLLSIKGQNFVGAITYGVGAIGQVAPRTAHSFLPELEAEIARVSPNSRMSVEQFSLELSKFFSAQWATLMANVPKQPGNDMVFLVGGYDEGAPYGRIFRFGIPGSPEPVEQLPSDGNFGLTWGGQQQFVDLLLRELYT